MLPAVVVAEAVEGVISDLVLATGSIEAVEEIYVSPLVEGLSIRSLEVDRGDPVEKGSTLVVLNDDALLLEKSQLQASLAKAEATLAQLQAQLVEARANSEEATRVASRAERLLANRTVSEAEVDRLNALATASRARVRSAEQSLSIAGADIRLARAQLDDVELRLARTSVKAPVSGVISAKNARVGAIASGSGQPLFAIIRDGAVEMKGDVAEADLVRLEVGQPAEVQLAGSSTTLQGRIRLIAPTVDPQTRLGTVYISLARAAEARPGMYASATIVAERKQAVLLPWTSVTSAGGRSTVRKVENGVVRLVPVTLGIQDGEFVEILSGIEAGGQVVAKAGAFVRDGDRIAPVKPAQPTPN
ncbi:efflux RND transporter periplasmic adaptor subunit [Arenibaculum pallidiluteum]|uniref:efflux RND transporter periplasmic adaptor subunit n=1 Tax=Arenibaculum pallidiluteum TaxID=2812559 RepID=UPI001A95C191|nr:efflux RND transporter periplasmic adaptor subunit [Arenibaculum pallidiluteum]